MSETGVSALAVQACPDAPESPAGAPAAGTLFTLPTSRREGPAHPLSGQPSTPAERAAWLDERLFTLPIFLIGEDNQKLQIPSQPRTLAEARQMVDAGTGRSFVAHARRGVCCVDIDGDDEEWALSALEYLIHFAEAKGLWWLSRRSGGGAGRFHLIVLIPPFEAYQHAEDELRSAVAEVRARWGATSRQIDWRRTLRPLTAPHRSTGAVEYPRDIDELWSRFPQWARIRELPERRIPPMRTEPTTPAMPWARGFREIGDPRFWGRLESPDADYASDRSLSELLSTARLVIAGYTVKSAWEVVCRPEYPGFARSRSRGWEWWLKYAWAAAVEYVDAHRPVTSLQTPQGRWSRVVGPLLLGVRNEFWDGLTPAERHSEERFLAAVGDRMARQGLAHCRLPERDLEQDSGLARNTVRRMRRLVEADGILIRVQDYDYSQGAKSSHCYALNLLALDFRGETTAPPCSHSQPHPGRSWYSLAVTLSLHPGPHTATSLYHLSGYTPRATPTKAQLENVGTGLGHLQSMRLARRNRKGEWELTGRAGRITRSLQARAHGRAARIAREREAFAEAWSAARAAWLERWEAQRARVQAKRAAADERRRDEWWASLPAEERASRRKEWQERFAALPQWAQRERVELLQQRRLAAALGAAA